MKCTEIFLNISRDTFLGSYFLSRSALFFNEILLKRHDLQSYLWLRLRHSVFQHWSYHQCEYPSTIFSGFLPPSLHLDRPLLNSVVQVWALWFLCCWLWCGYLAVPFFWGINSAHVRLETMTKHTKPLCSSLSWFCHITVASRKLSGVLAVTLTCTAPDSVIEQYTYVHTGHVP